MANLEFFTFVLRLDQEVLSFLDGLQLTKLAPIFLKEGLSMNDILEMSKDDLKLIGVERHKERKLIFDEKEKLKTTSFSTMSSKAESTLTSSMGQFSKKYRKVTFIGKGSFGEAWKVHLRHGSGEFILKEIICSEKDVLKGKDEIEFLKKCHHESIVTYIEDFYEKSKFLIIMEFCSGGDLAEFIEAQTQFLPEDFIIRWALQLTSGVCYIHKMKIIHRDLKPANIFLSSDKKLKIGDFGVAKGLDKTSGLASTKAGTNLYMAPEIHGGDKYNTMADVWSLGVVIFEIITYKRPFHGHNCLQAIFQG